MNTEQIEALKATAMAASFGPWNHTGDEYTDRGGEYQRIESSTQVIIGEFGVAADNAKYIAAASPDVILALLAEVEQARAAQQVAVSRNWSTSPLWGLANEWANSKPGNAAIKAGKALTDWLEEQIAPPPVAQQGGKAALTDAEILTLQAKHHFSDGGFNALQFARAIEARSGVNAKLVAALKAALKELNSSEPMFSLAFSQQERQAQHIAAMDSCRAALADAGEA